MHCRGLKAMRIRVGSRRHQICNQGIARLCELLLAREMFDLKAAQGR